MRKTLFVILFIAVVTIPAALAADVMVDLNTSHAKAVGTGFAGYQLNLTTETLSNTDGIVGCSYNGKQWYRIKPTWTIGTIEIYTKQFINKGGEFYITNGLNKYNKPDSTVDNFTVAVFNKIGKRPKSRPGNGIPYYEYDTWTYKEKKDADQGRYTYEYVLADEKGKGPAPGHEWAVFTELKAQSAPANGMKKPVYLFRIPAIEAYSNTPAIPNSKIWKVTPLVKGKAPARRVNYKHEYLQLNKGMKLGIKAVGDENPQWVIDAGKSSIKVDVSKYIDDAESIVLLCATWDDKGKKPVTEIQEIVIAPRAKAESGSFIVENGKINGLSKYEFRPANAASSTAWNRNMYSLSVESVACEMRKKATAVYVTHLNALRGEAGGEVMILTAKFEKDENGKDVIVSATYEPKPI